MSQAITYKLNDPAPGAPYFTPYQVIPAGTALNPQPSGNPIPKLFQPVKIRGVEFQNRIFVSPMCQYSAEDGHITPWHTAHLGGILTRGPGLTMIEATGVLPEGRITGDDTGIWSDAHIQTYASLTQFAHSQNQKIAIQLAHAGWKASTFPPWVSGPTPSPIAQRNPTERGWPEDVVGPTAKPFTETYPKPKELTKEGIKKVVDAFKDAAVRSVKAGFDVIEIHAAHGYLLSSFLSPNVNTRTDEYGGPSFENRIRFLLEVVDVVRSVIPETMPLFVRMSGTEWLEEVAPTEASWRKEDTARLAPILAEHGVDLLDVSTGGLDARQRIISGEAYQVPFAEAAKKAVGDKMLVGAVGSLGDGKVAQKVLENGQADVVFVGRQFQKNPGLVWAMADELRVEIHNGKQIGWGFMSRGRRGLGFGVKEKL